MTALEGILTLCLIFFAPSVLYLLVTLHRCTDDINRLIDFGRCLEARILYLEGELTKEDRDKWVERFDAPHNNMIKVREDVPAN